MRVSKLIVGCFIVSLSLFGCSDIQVGGPAPGSCSADSDCDEGAECTTGSCSNGQCAYDILPNWCFVDGACFLAGQELNGDRCQTCDPTLIQSGLVNKQCADGQACNSATGECEEPPQEDTVEPDASVSDVAADTGPADVATDVATDTEADTEADTTEPDLPPVPTPTCDDYCGTYMQVCGEVSEFSDAAECVAYCTTYASLPEGTSADTSGNTIGCRLNKLIDAQAPDFAGDLNEVCVAAGSTGGNVCGTWCENYCHLAFENCVGEPTYFETFNECKIACSNFPEDGTPGEKKGDTVQCRIYHLVVAGDELSGGAEVHCPHGSIAGTGGCEPLDQEDLCKSYCQSFYETCPEEVLEGKAYESADDCYAQCSEVPQDGQDGDSMGYTVQCLSYHVSQAEGDQAKKHCINGTVGKGSVCVNGPDLRITEIAPNYVNPITGEQEAFIEVMNVGKEAYQAKGSLLVSTTTLSPFGTIDGPIIATLKGLEELPPNQRFVIRGPGGDVLPVPPGTIIVEADIKLSAFGGLVSLIAGNGYFEVVTYGGDETTLKWLDYFDGLAWDYQGKPAPAVQKPNETLSRCPENQDTDDGSDFVVTEATLGESNACKDAENKDEKAPPMPGG